MVMYRDFVQRKARALGIIGEVENMEDRSVRVVAQGAKEDLEKFVGHLHKGPFLARVLNVDVTRREPSGKFDGFNIVY